MKKLLYVITFFVSLTTVTVSQTPQYYNFHNGGGFNNWPFNRPDGAAVNYLFIAGEFNQPSPIPPGQRITTVYFKMTSAGTRTFTSLQILMAQDIITNLTSGSFYPGPYDTVFNNTNVTCTSIANGWMSFTLDHGFNYDPTKSLIIFVGQCGYNGTGAFVFNFILSGVTRTISVGGCPFIPSPSTGGENSVLNFGVDVVPIVGVPNTNNEVPKRYGLEQNYPNPFNPTTKISYELPVTSYVTLIVYDMLGHEVKTLVNEKQSAETYQLEFNGSNLPSGVYYYKLTTEEYVETKKMMLMK